MNVLKAIALKIMSAMLFAVMSTLVRYLGEKYPLRLGWLVPTWPELAALVTVGLCGGLAHILLTESYRLAPASLVAPFDYTSMVWAFLLGYFFFSELPTMFVFVGAAIIAAAGLFVIWRERQLGLQRVRAAEGSRTGA